MINPLSYQSACAFPAKLLRYAKNLSQEFYPIHLQLIPTNRCNLTCTYCSCGDSDRSLEMSFEFFVEAVDKFIVRGLQAVTITGGGEPLMHPQFDKMVDYLHKRDICLGMSTNGILTKQWPVDMYRKFDWIRVSFDSHRDELPELYWTLEDKYAFSYVHADGAEKTDNFLRLMDMARQGSIAHLRIVSDISGKKDLRGLDITGPCPSNVIIQDRSISERGQYPCWLALAKPLLNADGLMYTCCCAQYALDSGICLYPKELCLGTIDLFLERYKGSQAPFNGEICKICYYGGYNRVLDAIKAQGSLKHTEFI